MEKWIMLDIVTERLVAIDDGFAVLSEHGGVTAPLSPLGAAALVIGLLGRVSVTAARHHVQYHWGSVSAYKRGDPPRRGLGSECLWIPL